MLRLEVLEVCSRLGVEGVNCGWWWCWCTENELILKYEHIVATTLLRSLAERQWLRGRLSVCICAKLRAAITGTGIQHWCGAHIHTQHHLTVH